ncbi:MAG: DUF1841 family protein [Pseudomonadota bacterium]
MFNPSRAEARQFLIDAWRKHRDRSLLTALEMLAVDHIQRHPEYHRYLEHPEPHLDQDWRPEAGETNPFLHLMLHLSISEQLSIDQPAGVRAAYLALAHAQGDEHAAQHAVMDCLAEMIWVSQRHGLPPDAAAYLDCLQRKTR